MAYIVKDEFGNEVGTLDTNSLRGTVGGWIRERIRENHEDGNVYHVYDDDNNCVVEATARLWPRGK